MQLNLKIKLLPMMLPNFIRIEGGDNTLAVEELSLAEAEEYGEFLKQAFVKHYKARILISKAS